LRKIQFTLRKNISSKEKIKPVLWQGAKKLLVGVSISWERNSEGKVLVFE
jgi:hypothetical protein